MAKYIWSLVALVVGANCRPYNLEQFWIWANSILQSGRKFHMVGLSTICWDIWLARNSVCFDRKIIRSPTEIICSASSFLMFWVELQKGGRQAKLKERAEALKTTALQFHPQRLHRVMQEWYCFSRRMAFVKMM
uniref:Uncharacterized protein n=1 Tax=Setaria viridis TaxID=4556 RepID=A0A4U6W987_SETVI|nr:hypothetical protein SEVIR_1G105300v2 [Setaria viridis]